MMRAIDQVNEGGSRKMKVHMTFYAPYYSRVLFHCERERES